MNDDGKAVAKVVAITRGVEQWQFVLGPNGAVVLGRAADCDVVLPSRGVSGRHCVLRHQKKEDGTWELFIEDVSTNGTGVSAGSEWLPVRKESKALLRVSQIVLPFNCKAQEEAVVLTVYPHGSGLPDAYDSKRKTGRWMYRGKLGEGGLGVVYRAADASGKLKGDVAIKVCKLAKDVKPTAKLRSAFILHREAQWSIQRLHNSSYKKYSPQKASLFARYLEDHTGRWSRDLDFDLERGTFEAPDFRWDKFRPSEPMPQNPYVAMEYVPGRTLHSALGWSRDQPLKDEAHLSQEEKESIVSQAAEALLYLVDNGLIHRDFRTTNLMVSERRSTIRVRVIDLGHTILAENHQCRNKSAVVRCNWKEEEKKRFDWAPPEVKARENFVNFAYPAHSFDVFSFGVLTVQLQTSGMQAARLAVQRLMGVEKGEKLDGKLGFSKDVLALMLGEPGKRPHAESLIDVLKRKEDDVEEGEDAKERKQQGGVVDAEIEEVIEGEMADSPHSAKATADSDRVDKSASAKGVQMSSASAKGVQISAKAPEKSNEVKGKRPQESRVLILRSASAWTRRMRSRMERWRGGIGRKGGLTRGKRNARRRRSKGKRPRQKRQQRQRKQRQRKMPRQGRPKHERLPKQERRPKRGRPRQERRPKRGRPRQKRRPKREKRPKQKKRPRQEKRPKQKKRQRQEKRPKQKRRPRQEKRPKQIERPRQEQRPRQEKRQKQERRRKHERKPRQGQRPRQESRQEPKTRSSEKGVRTMSKAFSSRHPLQMKSTSRKSKRSVSSQNRRGKSLLEPRSFGRLALPW
ncbi:unnamed protein product [Effrenium voratum]|nr:unnamed protein product [Effrenium voratum]